MYNYSKLIAREIQFNIFTFIIHLNPTYYEITCRITPLHAPDPMGTGF